MGSEEPNHLDRWGPPMGPPTNSPGTVKGGLFGRRTLPTGERARRIVAHPSPRFSLSTWQPHQIVNMVKLEKKGVKGNLGKLDDF